MTRLNLLAVCTLLAFLVACGGQPTPPGNDDTPPPPPPDSDECAVTIRAADITTSTRLTKTTNACDYYIERYIHVGSGTLTIEPGTVIKFGPMAYIYIGPHANVVAVGTAEARITFEGARPIKGFANGFRLSTRDDTGLVNHIEYADFRYLGVYSAVGPNPSAAIMGFQRAPLILKNTTVSGSISASAVSLRGTDLIEFANNSFFDNEGYGVAINAAQVHKLDAASDYRGQTQPNGLPYISIRDSLIDDVTWKQLNAPYGIGNQVEVIAATLTIEPGTTFVLGENANLWISRGALKAVGTPDAPIVFTGPEPKAGAWGQLKFFGRGGSESPENILEYVEVRYGGKDEFGLQAVIALELNAYLNMSHTIVADSAGAGVCVDWFLGADFEQGPGNVFENIPHGDVLDEC